MIFIIATTADWERQYGNIEVNGTGIESEGPCSFGNRDAWKSKYLR